MSANGASHPAPGPLFNAAVHDRLFAPLNAARIAYSQAHEAALRGGSHQASVDARQALQDAQDAYDAAWWESSLRHQPTP